MGYSACFTIDVNMFWIFYIVCFFPCSQAVVFNKIFNLLYKQLVFIYAHISHTFVCLGVKALCTVQMITV